MELPEEIKKWHQNFSRQAVLKLWIKTDKILFGSITQELLDLIL